MPCSSLSCSMPTFKDVPYLHIFLCFSYNQVEKWNDYFKLFTRGQILFGNYIKHCVDWYKQIDKPNIFFITYEDLKADHRGSVEKLAKFLEKVSLVEHINV